jgi:hypothetical protein
LQPLTSCLPLPWCSTSVDMQGAISAQATRQQPGNKPAGMQQSRSFSSFPRTDDSPRADTADVSFAAPPVLKRDSLQQHGSGAYAHLLEAQVGGWACRCASGTWTQASTAHCLAGTHPPPCFLCCLRRRPRCCRQVRRRRGTNRRVILPPAAALGWSRTRLATLCQLGAALTWQQFRATAVCPRCPPASAAALSTCGQAPLAMRHRPRAPPSWCTEGHWSGTTSSSQMPQPGVSPLGPPPCRTPAGWRAQSLAPRCPPSCRAGCPTRSKLTDYQPHLRRCAAVTHNRVFCF